MLKYTTLETDLVQHWQDDGLDANAQIPERRQSDGDGNPCRHCLTDIPAGAPMLILAHRPFDGLHPYAETGPIFVCADPCSKAHPTQFPQILTTSPDYLLKGYSSDERIVYGTGAITPADQINAKAADLFSNPKVAFVHVRSARNNCYQLRIDRA